MPQDLSPEQINYVASEIRAALQPLADKYKLKYVITGLVQKNSDPNVGTHFTMASDMNDPMWAVIAMARGAQAFAPAAEAQRAGQTAIDAAMKVGKNEDEV